MTGKGTGLRAAAWLALTIATGSCGGDPEGGAGDRTTTTTRRTAPAFADPATVELALKDLQDAAQRTVDEPTLRFRMVVDTSSSDAFAGSSMRTGAFDVAAKRGSATFVVTPEDVDDAFAGLQSDGSEVTLEDSETSFGKILESAAGHRLEFRLVDGTFWQGVPEPSGRRWNGTDASTGTNQLQPGNALVARVGGGVIVHALSEAVVRVRGIAEGPAQALVWDVELDGDQIGPLSTGAGMFGRLTDIGFDGTSGVRVDARFTVDAEGRVVRVESDLSEWWRAVFEEATGEVVDGLAVRVVFAFDGFGVPVVVTVPCPEPATDNGYRFPVLVCPG